MDNKQYVMYYEAVASDNRRTVGLAVSKDGMKGWKRCPYPVFEPAAPSPSPSSAPSTSSSSPSAAASAWDAGAVGQPCAVSMSKGKWRLYYAGRNSPSSGEGFLHTRRRRGRFLPNLLRMASLCPPTFSSLLSFS